MLNISHTIDHTHLLLTLTLLLPTRCPRRTSRGGAEGQTCGAAPLLRPEDERVSLSTTTESLGGGGRALTGGRAAAIQLERRDAA